MSRVIKFRGYQPELKKWVYGDLIRVPDWASFIFEWRNNFEDRIKVDSDSVGQFTGLRDKNNVEIYEGDIVWTYEHGIGNLNRVVVFDDGSFLFEHPNMLRSELRGWKPSYMEVKGNIFSNPELLTEKQ